MTQNGMSNGQNEQRPHVVIIGGGFGGLYAARSVGRRARARHADRPPQHHLFQPLLYQVATAGLSPGNIAAPMRFILRRHKNIRVWLGEVVNIDPPRTVRIDLLGGTTLDFDYLIVATGSSHSYFGNDAWEAFAPGLKSVENTLDGARAASSTPMSRPSSESDPARRTAWMTFVVVGGGPTGVELAGALARDGAPHAQIRLPRHRPGGGDRAARRSVRTTAPSLFAPRPRPEPSLVERLGVTVRTSMLVVGMDEKRARRCALPDKRGRRLRSKKLPAHDVMGGRRDTPRPRAA